MFILTEDPACLCVCLAAGAAVERLSCMLIRFTQDALGADAATTTALHYVLFTNFGVQVTDVFFRLEVTCSYILMKFNAFRKL